MKELSIEQKAKRYDEAFERARKLYNSEETIADVEIACENIFPSLKESEDEKIKEDLIQWISDFPDMLWGGHYREDVIKWLEKQGEQKQDVSIQISPSEYVNDMGGNGCYLKNATQASTWSKKEEKVDNQNCVKSADDIKPKFKVGDWISNDMCDVHIESIENGMYYFDEGDGLSIVFVDEHYHLWTIEDARDGDILAFNDETIVIFKDLYNRTSFHSYCHIEDGIFTVSEKDMPDWWEGEGFYPATRKQRDLLFAKMKEAGCMFDFEKKELKKLGQPEVTKTSDQEEIAEIPFGAKDSELQEAIYNIPKGFYAKIKGDIVLIKKGKQKPEWSEEDEHRVKDTIYFLDTAKKHYASTVELDACIDWLKSIKDKHTWKPSEEQIKAFEHFVRSIGESGYASLYENNTKLLYSLLEQLKKL